MVGADHRARACVVSDRASGLDPGSSPPCPSVTAGPLASPCGFRALGRASCPRRFWQDENLSFERQVEAMGSGAWRVLFWRLRYFHREMRRAQTGIFQILRPLRFCA